jgi:DNA-binding NtrC family response regulator
MRHPNLNPAPERLVVRHRAGGRRRVASGGYALRRLSSAHSWQQGARVAFVRVQNLDIGRFWRIFALVRDLQRAACLHATQAMYEQFCHSLTLRDRSPMTERLLCIDDDEDAGELLAATLRQLGYQTEITTSPAHALELVVARDFHAVISDLSMAEMDGLRLCERILEKRPGMPVIVVTGQGSMEAAVGAMRVGAYDFITKPVDPKLLGMRVARAVRTQHLQLEVSRLRQALSESPEGTALVGDSSAVRGVNELIHRVAKSDASVLIFGETGTGKELVARALHRESGRGPFVAVNCAAVAPSLLESELFGHTRGAFTDAKMTRRGLFQEATGGTLFLDEVGEMPPEMQAKLLRALQERVVRPVGSDTEQAFDARIITATHRDLEDDVAKGRFRQDLFYRINVVSIYVPPLRERGADVLRLASHFLKKSADRTGQVVRQLSPAVAERLLAYNWPGNVRELENCMERAVALARFDELTLEDLPERVRRYRADQFVMTANEVEEILPLEELEQRYIARTLKLLNGNKARAAVLLGVDRRTLYRRLGRYASGSNSSSGEAVAS